MCFLLLLLRLLLLLFIFFLLFFLFLLFSSSSYFFFSFLNVESSPGHTCGWCVTIASWNWIQHSPSILICLASPHTSFIFLNKIHLWQSQADCLGRYPTLWISLSIAFVIQLYFHSNKICHESSLFRYFFWVLKSSCFEMMLKYCRKRQQAGGMCVWALYFPFCK